MNDRLASYAGETRPSHDGSLDSGRPSLLESRRSAVLAILRDNQNDLFGTFHYLFERTHLGAPAVPGLEDNDEGQLTYLLESDNLDHQKVADQILAAQYLIAVILKGGLENLDRTLDEVRNLLNRRALDSLRTYRPLLAKKEESDRSAGSTTSK